MYANRRHALATLVRRRACLRPKRLASLRDRDAFTEVGRSFKEGMVTVEEEKERPCDESITIIHVEYIENSGAQATSMPL